jgi:oligopeptide transport system substrate-binding protein
VKNKKIWAIVIVITLLAVTLTGCGEKSSKTNKPKDEPEKIEGKATDVEMDDEQYIVLTQVEPQALDPAKSNDIYSADILNEITEGLARMEVDEDGNDVVASAGAESWDVSEDGLVWTFHLRDYNWSDGEPVTAQDFEYGIKRTINPETAAVYAFLLYPIKNAEVCNNGEKDVDELGVKALDEKTLEITLEGPCAYFEKLIPFRTFLPQRKDFIEKCGDKFGSEANYTISCGPFELEEWTHKSELVLKKNENYWDADNVHLEKVMYKIIEDPNTACNMLSNGQLDVCGVKQPEWVEKFKARDDMEYMTYSRPSTSYQFFNQDIELFTNVNIRKAFILALDREEIIDVLFYDVGEPAYGWVPPSMQIGNEKYRDLVDEPLKKLVEENLEPKDLLVKGLKELGMDPDPSKLTVTILEGGTDAENRRFTEYYQQAYETVLGINVEAEYVDWPVFMDRVASREYEIAGMGWTGDYNDPMTFMDMWMTGLGQMRTGWSNEKYNELIKKAQNSLDEKERLESFKQAEEILLCEEAVISPIRYQETSTFVYNYVKNIMNPLFGSGWELKYAYIQGRTK